MLASMVQVAGAVSEGRMIKSIFWMPNGMLFVCDQAGQQMPEFQGLAGEYVERALAAAGPDTRVYGFLGIAAGTRLGDVDPPLVRWL